MNKATTPEFRVSFPNVFKARKNDLNGKDEYSLVALFKKGTDLSPLKSLAAKAVEEKWGTDKSKHPANIRSPFRDQGERAKDGALPAGYEAGAIFLNLKSTQRPGVVDQDVQDIIDESQFYPGCWAKATVTAFAYDQKGNRGVSFGLRNIQKVRDGEPLSGRAKAQDDFEPIADAGGSATDMFG